MYFLLNEMKSDTETFKGLFPESNKLLWKIRFDKCPLVREIFKCNVLVNILDFPTKNV